LAKAAAKPTPRQQQKEEAAEQLAENSEKE
jgi:hypothetical protein